MWRGPQAKRSERGEGMSPAPDGLVLNNSHTSLRHWWHPVARTEDVGDSPYRVQLLGTPWVVARLGDGLSAFLDRCPHRFAPLSSAHITDGVTKMMGTAQRSRRWERTPSFLPVPASFRPQAYRSVTVSSGLRQSNPELDCSTFRTGVTLNTRSGGSRLGSTRSAQAT